MWLQTIHGFVSIVEETDGPNRGCLVMRARERHHLEAMIALAPVGAATAISVTPWGDYRYRAWLSRATAEAIVGELISAISYGNFKDAVGARHGKDSLYSVALGRAWALFARMQPHGPYGYGGHGYPSPLKGEAKRKRRRKRSAQAQLPV